MSCARHFYAQKSKLTLQRTMYCSQTESDLNLKQVLRVGNTNSFTVCSSVARMGQTGRFKKKGFLKKMKNV